MADELVDVFDEDGKSLGTMMKSKAHKIGAWHRAVHIFLVNDKNEVLIQLRSPEKELFPNRWDISAAGHVGAGEKTIDAALRELSEELGVQAKPSEFKYLFTFKEIFEIGNDYLSKEFVDVFFLRRNVEKSDIKLQEEEVANFKFMPITELFEMSKRQESDLVPHQEEYEKVKLLYPFI